ncbi:MAG: tetratricopeptide repeat protein [Bacteroidales bacterium]|nr:tetratricopeptide repeat protein [Bacteroidales bacterium]
MEEDDDLNREEIDELVEDFKAMADAGESRFFDSDDLEIIIEELIARFDFTYATEAVEHGIRLYPHSSIFRILKVKKLIMELEIGRAGRELDAIEHEFEPTAEFYLEKAFFYKMSGSEQDALPLLKKAYRLAPDDPEINFMLGGELVKKTDYRAALHHISFALENDEFIDEQMFTVSYIFEDDKHYEEAVLFFEQLTKDFPLSKGCWFALGLAYSWTKQYEQAIEAYEYAISLDEETSTAYFNIGNVYFEMKDYPRALKYYQETLRLDDQDYHAMSGVGDCYFAMNQYDKALECYHQALLLEPNTIDAIMGIITILKETGRAEEAEEFIKKSFSISPQSFDLLFDVLPFYEEEEQISKMKELFQLTIKQLKNKEDFLKFFTIYCTANERLCKMGIELLEEYLDDEEVTHVLPYLLAALHYLIGNISEANNYLKTALLINYEDHKMFLSLHPSLEELTVVQNLIELYHPN